MKLKLLYLWIAFLGFVLACTPSRKLLLDKKLRDSFDQKYVRILLFKTDQKVKISSSSRIKVVEKDSGKIIYDLLEGNFVIYPGEIKEPVKIESWESPLQVNGKSYRGMLELNNVLNKLLVINVLKLEEYLFSVVPSEIPSSWPLEALKAQAVSARTYTYYHLQKRSKKKFYDLDSTTNFQVYKGLEAENMATTQAVEETAGEIMLYQYKPILAYFHSTCGGKTADDEFVWSGENLPYLKSKRCGYCQDSPNYKWETELTLDELNRYLGKKYKKIGPIEDLSFQKDQGRVTQVKIKHKYGSLNISGNNFRLLFPLKKIKSTFFKSQQTRKGLHLTGHGWGHGVGLCQWGARGMANQGFNYKSILQHYYDKVRIVKFQRKSSFK